MGLIDVTVKTLDSQNRNFSVPDDVTVKQFKERIASSVSIPADKQRLIYCGRVLQDDKKLAEYNVHEKVVHLVMRAPPQSTSRGDGGANSSSTREHGTARQRHIGSRPDGGHVLFGSIVMPDDDDAVGAADVPGPSSSNVRLQQAKSMLESAQTVLDQLDARFNNTSNNDSSSSSGASQDQAKTEVKPEQEKSEPMDASTSESPSGEPGTSSSSEAMEERTEGDGAAAPSPASSSQLRKNPVSGTVTPPAQDMDAMYTEMDALNNANPNNMEPGMMGGTTLLPSPLQLPPIGGINTLAGGLAQAASAAVVSALSSMARGQGQTNTATRTTSASSSTTGTTTSSSSTTGSTPSTNNTTTSSTASPNRTATTSSSTPASSSQPSTPGPRTMGSVRHQMLSQDQLAGLLAGGPASGMRGFTLRISNGRRRNQANVPGRPNGSGGSESAGEDQPASRSEERRSQSAPRARPRSASANRDSTSQSTNRGERGGVRLEHPRPSMMVETLDLYQSIQRRLVPYLARYYNVMNSDPTYDDNTPEVQSTDQWVVWMVSEVLHYLSHALHAISDIMVDLRRPPPRQLRGRPIIIQQPAVVQAQINVTTSENRTSTTPPTNSTETPSSTAASTATPTATAPSTTTSPPTSQTETSQSTPTSTSNSTRPNHPLLNLGQMQGIPIDDEGVVLMQLGPNGILIDSMGMQGNGTASPEMIQSLMSSITSQLGGRVEVSTSNSSTTSESVSTPTTSVGVRSRAAMHNVLSGLGGSGTSTTNVTQTRVTPRPHVHVTPFNVPVMGMSQFDPFLPCQSHHIRNARRRRRAPAGNENASSNRTAGGSEAASTGASTATPAPPITPAAQLAALRETVNSLFSGLPQGAQRATDENNTSDTSNNTEGSVFNDDMFLRFVNRVMTEVVLGGESRGENQTANNMSLYEFLDNYGIPVSSQGTSEEDNSISSRLITTVARNMSLFDFMQLFWGQTASLRQLSEPLTNFIREHLLEGRIATDANIDSAVDRFIEELQPHIELAVMNAEVNDDIDSIATINNFIRFKFSRILRLFLFEGTSSTFETELMLLMTQAISEFVALSVHCLRDGTTGLERIIRERIRGLFSEMSPNIQTWSIEASISRLRGMVNNMTIDDDHIRHFVRNQNQGRRPLSYRERQKRTRTTDSSADAASNGHSEEPMDVDEVASTVEISTTENRSSLQASNTEAIVPPVPLPWHTAVPQEWIPVITRDVERQRRGVPDTPLSDAYLNGMPVKRRKIASQHKPHGSVQSVMADTLRQSMRSAGVNRTVMDTVANEVSNQMSETFSDHVRTCLRDRLLDNKDFKPDKFPKSDQNIRKDKK